MHPGRRTGSSVVEPRSLMLEARGGLLELLRDGLRTSPTGCRTATYRAPRFEQRQAVRAEPRIVRHQFVEWDAPLDRLAHQRADDRVRFTERYARLHEELCEVGRRIELAVGAGGHRLLDELGTGEQSGQRAERQTASVERIEQRLLVFLQIAVVCERQRLERREEAGELTDDAARLAARQFSNVRILLLRQHR